MNKLLSACLIPVCFVVLSACVDETAEDNSSDDFDVTVKIQDTEGVTRDSFFPSETMQMSINIENVANENFTILFEDEQKFEFKVTDTNDKVVWTWSDNRTFDTQATSITLEPDESYGARYNWNLLLSDSTVLPAGKYTLSANVLRVNETATAAFTMLE